MKKFTKPAAPVRIESANNFTRRRNNSAFRSRGIFFAAVTDKMKPFLLVFESISTPESGYGFGRKAFVNMFVFADSREQAEDRAIRHLNNAGWIKVELLAAFGRQDPPNWDERWLKAYRQAEYQGVGFHVGILPDDLQPGFQEGE